MRRDPHGVENRTLSEVRPQEVPVSRGFPA
jgi:hypothetical protein